MELGPLTDPTLIPQAVAHALGVREQPGTPLLEILVETLKAKNLLLLLDNCEHLLGGAGDLVETLLRACPGVRILATSREALGAIGETVWWLPSLAVPPSMSTRCTAEIARTFESVQLFCARAASAHPAFALTDANAPAVAAICRRLDGIPLALELAGARARILTPEQIAARLDERFRLLTGGDRAVPRHETLRAALDWSYGLLSAPEQRLLARLSVFAGGCDLEAAEAVCADGEQGVPREQGTGNREQAPPPSPNPYSLHPVPSDAIFDLLTSMAEKSLLVVEYHGEAARYRLLETVRQYAADRLAVAGETEAVRSRHANWALALAQHAAPRLVGSEQETWLQRLELEHDNLRAVLQWTLDSGGTVLGLQLAGALWRFWQTRGYLTEGRTWLERLLAHGEGVPPSVRAAALFGAGVLAHDQGDYTSAVPYVEHSLALYQDTGEEAAAEALLLLGALAWRRSEYATAAAHCEESLTIARAADDRRLTARCLNLLGLIAMDQGRYPTAHDRFEEALALARDLGDLRTSAVTLSNLGLTAHRLETFERARVYL
ncbi:MAG: ATP-binding protein, partial [Dehalococcoidia bacterium]